MKNIHILPTDKPSRLHISSKGKLILSSTPVIGSKGDIKNIYITSKNKDINENDYIITKDCRLVQVSYLLSKDLEGASKVILTTDQDLIKDGVQAIDDEFLEWFVKNPSCEEVNTSKIKTRFRDEWRFEYKIIIPKEEPKQELFANGERVYLKEDNNVSQVVDDNTKDWSLWERLPKQETLEEALKSYVLTMSLDQSVYIDFLQCAEFGAQWQQERSYSEEEVIQLVSDWTDYRMSEDSKSKVTFKKWFEKFKK